MSGTAVRIVSALAIVLAAFTLTLYLLNWWSGSSPSETATESSVSNSISTPAVEGQNLLWPSEDFANPKWDRYQIAAVEPSAEKSPNGNNTASRVVESADNGRHFISTTVVGATPGAFHTFSVYFKQGERSIRLETADIPKGKYGGVFCNPSENNAVGSVVQFGDAVGGAVESLGGGWYRCWAAMPYNLATGVLNIELRDQNGANPFQGDGHSGVVIWGAQFAPGRRPTAYVPTTTGPVAKVN